jgi:putative nucleotidyltransferase with HDIG domain
VEVSANRRASAPEPFDLGAAMVQAMAGGTVRVPPYPAVALQVEKLVRKDDYAIEDLTKLVSSDQALAADALRCANSAFYSRGTPATALGPAIARIGGREMARLAIASGLGVHARTPGPLSTLRRRIWLDGLASAALCQELGRNRRVSPEEAFICGLLHDFGRMVAVSCIEEILEKHPEQAPMPLEHWLEVVDRYHVELGLVLAAKWDLPPGVSDVISMHHAEDLRGTQDPRMLELVMASDEVVKLLGESIYLTPEDLGVASLLTGAECELVSRVLDRLPAFIASFEGEAPPMVPGHSLVAPDPEPEDDVAGPTPVDFPVRVVVGREKREFRAMGIATSNLMVNGKQALPENVLVQIEMGCPTPLTCWATAKLSWPEGAGYTVLLQPFALNGKAHDVWKDLLRKTLS